MLLPVDEVADERPDDTCEQVVQRVVELGVVGGSQAPYRKEHHEREKDDVQPPQVDAFVVRITLLQPLVISRYFEQDIKHHGRTVCHGAGDGAFV